MAVRLPRSPQWRQVLTMQAIDGALLGTFMLSVGTFGSLIFSPASPFYHLTSSDLVRRLLMGAAMGLTAVALIYSPWGGRSGAHMNPAVTLAFLRLGRIRPLHALGYVIWQFAFGLLGVLAISAIMGSLFTGDPVRYAPTVPGRWGLGAAFAAELAMTFTLMLTLLYVSNTRRLAAYTPWFAGLFLFAYIALAGPISGMSLNPARTLASAVPSGEYTAIWIYFTAPVLGMLLSAELFVRLRRLPAVHCCKLNHLRREICIHCGCDGPIDFDAHRSDRHPAPTALGEPAR